MKTANKMPGGLGGPAEITALRRRIAALALPHVESAVRKIVELLEAKRETVSLQAATTLLELAETGGEGLGETTTVERKLTLVVSGTELSAELAARNQESE